MSDERHIDIDDTQTLIREIKDFVALRDMDGLKKKIREYYPFLDPQQKREMDALLKSLAKNTIQWQPYKNFLDPSKPSVQELACTTPAFETLMTGSVYFGKSFLLLGLAGTEHEKSLLLRRKFPQLEKSLISDSFALYGDRKNYNASKHVWRIGKRRVYFGHVNNEGTPENPGDEAEYSSAQFDLIAFDQLEEFSLNTYLFLFSRARTVNPKQRVRVISSANFVGSNIRWIFERWGAWLDEKHPHPAKYGEVRWYKRDKDGREVESTKDDPDALSRTLIFGTMQENPYAQGENGESYRRQLMAMREPYRSALLNGDIHAMIQDDPFQVIPTQWVTDAMNRWTEERPDVPMTAMGMDLSHGGSDQTCYACRYENWLAPLVTYPGSTIIDGMKAAEYAVQVVESKSTPINGDVIGWGASACEHLEYVLGYNVNKVNFGENSHAYDKSGKFKFGKKRIQYYWQFAELLSPESEVKIALPPDSELKADLTAMRWKQSGSTINGEDKDEIKARLGRSPDKGDAVVLAFIEPSLPGFRTLG